MADLLTLAPPAEMLTVADMLETVAAELREQGGKARQQAALVIATHGDHYTDTDVHFAGGVRNVAEAVGLLELGKAQTLRPDE